ncbi:meiosis-specific coiled-coil domain-containing protein MEIOC [Chanos chanos]|uniref:Meiosis-specific coiled-coil domain-containing protein MEIOC n=1 Tax=Chanos chanos TaxID=29144 RepID=A0A6J2X064_CHACN|nr:meiosis-specific coiled-coil domain-containing protein MEIOC [Chanos chanos]
MAFDGFQSSEADLYFSPYRLQTHFSGDSGRLAQSYNPLPDFPVKEDMPPPYTPWATQDDSYQPMDYAQGNPKNRNVLDGNECENEADLYGLVSNILEEADRMESYFSEDRVPSSLKGVWSPKCMREDSLQFFNPDVKIQTNSDCQSNHVSSSQTANRDSRQRNDLYRHFNGLDTTDTHWLPPSYTGETEDYCQPIQGLPRPPGLDAPSGVNSPYLSKNRSVKSEYSITAGKDSGCCGATNILADHAVGAGDSYFSPYPDFMSRSRAKEHRNRPSSGPDANRLASTMQALFTGQQERPHSRDPVQNRPVSLMHYEDKTAEQSSFPSPGMSAFDAQTSQFKKEFAGGFGVKRAGETGIKRLPLQNENTYKDFAGFGHQQELPKSFSSSFSSPTPYPSKGASQRGPNIPQPSLNQYFSHYAQENHQHQTQTKLPAKTNGNTGPQGLSKLMSHSVGEFVPLVSYHQMPRSTAQVLPDFGQDDGPGHQCRKGPPGLGLEVMNKGAGEGIGFDLHQEKSRLLTAAAAAGLMGNPHSLQNFVGKPAKTPASLPRETEKKQGLLQNPYLDGFGNTYGNQTRHNSAGAAMVKTQSPLFLPYLYQMADPRQNMCPLFPSRTQIPYCSGTVPLMDLGDVHPDGDMASFNPYLQEMMGSGQGMDGPFAGFLSALRSPKLGKSHGSPTSQLHYYLEDCYEQWRMLEKERKRAEVILAKNYPGKRMSMTSTNTLPKMPPNPSRVDRVIVDQLREQAKVVSLLGKMERLRSLPLHANICTALDKHLEAIYITQARRKDEFITCNRQRQGPAYYREDRDILLLASALKDLSSSTRKSRTALWCGLQMTLPRTDTHPDEGGERHTCAPVGQGRSGQASPERALPAF